MALITIASDVSIDGNSVATRLSGLMAGEALLAGAPCRVHTDGKVYMSITTSAAIATLSDFVGFAADAVESGMPVTLFGKGARFNFASGMAVNKPLYCSATAGRLSDALILAGDSPVALSVSATDIVVTR
jgi:hypothetical protein